MKNDAQQKPKRRRILINKTFQLKFSFFLLIPIIIIQNIFWISIEFFFKNMIREGNIRNLPEGHSFYSLLAYQKKELLVILVFSSIIVSIIMFIWGLYISRRIAGPLYKLEMYLNESKTLEEVVNKKLEFRKSDFFLNIPEAFNHFIQRIKK